MLPDKGVAMVSRRWFFVALPFMVLTVIGMRVQILDTATIEMQPVPVQFESISWDHHAATAAALESLVDFIESTATTTTTVRSVVSTTTHDVGDDVWDRLAQCESNGRWDTSTGNGYGGGLQFAHTSQWSTWRAFGGEQFATHPWDATREQQIVVAERVLARSGWGAWPGCTRAMGLR